MGWSDATDLCRAAPTPSRPATSTVPAGSALYIGPTVPTDWLTNDLWLNNW